MAKKTDSKSKPASPAKRVAKPAVKDKPVVASVPAPAPVVAPSPVPVPAPTIAPKALPKATKSKAAPPKAVQPEAAKPKVPKAPKPPSYTQADVALRAYFIAEKRRTHGLPGDEHHDWIEAERQLAAESKRPKKTAKA